METPCWSPAAWAPTWRSEINENIWRNVLLQNAVRSPTYISKHSHKHLSRNLNCSDCLKKNRLMRHFLRKRDSLLAAIFDLVWREPPNFKLLYLTDGECYRAKKLSTRYILRTSNSQWRKQLRDLAILGFRNLMTSRENQE